MSIEATMSGLGPETVSKNGLVRRSWSRAVARATQPPGAVEDGELLRSLAFARRPKIVTVYNVTHIDC